MIPPVLTTDRLLLRPFQPEDLDGHAAALADPEVVRFLGGSTASREEAWRKILTVSGAWSLLGYGYWAVARRSDGAYLGQVGFADFKRDIRPSIEGLPEIGWVMTADAQGQGYASEAATAAFAWLDATLDAPETTAIIDPENAASIRVAEKVGFDRREDAVYRDTPIIMFRRYRSLSG